MDQALIVSAFVVGIADIALAVYDFMADKYLPGVIFVALGTILITCVFRQVKK